MSSRPRPTPPRPPRPVVVDTIRDEDAFAALATEWDALLASSLRDSPFLTHDWLLSWWRAYGEGARLHVMTCRSEDGALIGVLALYLRVDGGMLPVRTLRLLGDAGIRSLGLGPISAEDSEAHVAAHLATALRASSAEWDVLDLRAIEADTPFFHLMKRPAEGMSVSVDRDRHRCPQVPLPDDWESYLMQRLTKRGRSNVRRSRRKMREDGLVLESVTESSEIPDALDDLLRLFEERMRQAVGPRFRVEPDTRVFLANLFPRLLEKDRLRLAFLDDGRERVAAEYDVRHGDVLYALMGGFSAERADREVGRALFSHAIENAIREGCTRLDYGQGDQTYKHTWGVGDVRSFSDVRVYGGSAAARLRRGKDAAVEGGKRAFLAAPASVREPILRALSVTARTSAETAGPRRDA